MSDPSWKPAAQGPVLKQLRDKNVAVFLITPCLSSTHISMKERVKYYILLGSRNKILNKTITLVSETLMGNIDTNNYIIDATPSLTIRLRERVQTGVIHLARAGQRRWYLLS